MILDQLLEKKDLYIYLKYRIFELQKAEIALVRDLKADKSLTSAKRLQHAIFRLKGGMRELKRIKACLETGRLKNESKRMWRPNKDTKDEMGES